MPFWIRVVQSLDSAIPLTVVETQDCFGAISGFKVFSSV